MMAVTSAQRLAFQTSGGHTAAGVTGGSPGLMDPEPTVETLDPFPAFVPLAANIKHTGTEEIKQ